MFQDVKSPTSPNLPAVKHAASARISGYDFTHFNYALGPTNTASLGVVVNKSKQLKVMNKPKHAETGSLQDLRRGGLWKTL